MGKTLSIMPYYGSKYRMAQFISERLNYNTDIFVSMFGGACKVLLNKPPHKYEIYNDFGSGVCAVMEALSKPDTAQELIDRLYYETEYIDDAQAEAQFQKCKEIFDLSETFLIDVYEKELKKILIRKKVMPSKNVDMFIRFLAERTDVRDIDKKLKEEIDDICEEIETEITEICKVSENENKKGAGEALKKGNDQFMKRWKNIKIKLYDLYDKDEGFKTIMTTCLRLWAEGSQPRIRDMLENRTITDMDLAVATYIVYTFSFSGMGKGYGKGKFKNDEEYKKHILQLYPCADRLQGIEVKQLDAMAFIDKEFRKKMKSLGGLFENSLFIQWLDDPNLMMFCDPSYIGPKSEESILHNKKEGIEIDVNQEDSISEAIEREWKGKKMPKNLGEVYVRSFGYKEQELFLQGIQDAKCKMLVCNYDLELYNKYLNEDTGWIKDVYPTKTSASGKGGNNERLECIWYNY